MFLYMLEMPISGVFVFAYLSITLLEFKMTKKNSLYFITFYLIYNLIEIVLTYVLKVNWSDIGVV